MEEQLALAVHRALVSYWVDCQARAQHSSTLVAGLEVQVRFTSQLHAAASNLVLHLWRRSCGQYCRVCTEQRSCVRGFTFVCPGVKTSSLKTCMPVHCSS